MAEMSESTLPGHTFRSKSELPILMAQAIERPPVYKKTYQEDNLRAYEDVKEGKLSIWHAAEQYRVSKSTLSDRVTGRVKFDTNSGLTRYLTDREEEELVSFICHCAKIGYAKTRKEVMAIVSKIISSKTKGEHSCL